MHLQYMQSIGFNGGHNFSSAVRSEKRHGINSNRNVLFWNSCVCQFCHILQCIGLHEVQLSWSSLSLHLSSLYLLTCPPYLLLCVCSYMNLYLVHCSKQISRSTPSTATTTPTPACSSPSWWRSTSMSSSSRRAACCRRWLTSRWTASCWRPCRRSASTRCSWLNCSSTPTLSTGRAG